MRVTTVILAVFLAVVVCTAGGYQVTPEQMANAVGAMRSINTAEVTYAAQYKERGFACELPTFGSGPEKDKYDADHAGFLDESLTSGQPRNGYIFKVWCTDKTTPHKMFKTQAEPESGKGKAFCSDQSGLIRYSDDGKASTCLKSGTPLK